jgi:hypothetical protein
MRFSIFDIETDGLVSTKIHCLAAIRYNNGVRSTITFTNYNDMAKFLEEEEILIGHNIVRFDIPELQRILKVKIKARLLDTLAFSWYLFPLRPKHGLDEWGNDFGIQKPPIDNWRDLPVETYMHRCQEDTKINEKLFFMQKDYLKAIYGDAGIDRIMDYLTWKMDCAREQEQIKWRVDIDRCRAGISKLEEEEIRKVNALAAAMPDNILYKINKRPKNPYKKDGSHSEAGKRWFEILNDLGLPEDYSQPIRTVAGTEKGNPGSFTQLKRWLDSLGWEPQTFKFAKDENHQITKRIPQINNADNTGVCESVKRLFEKEPALENLEGLFIIRHRLGLLKGFLRDMDSEGFVEAEIAGLTNTLRFQHKTVVNLPKVSRPYGELVRGCLIAPNDEYTLCGSDMSALEDTTKQHYMFFFDPEYVKKMRVPGFDPHLSMAVFAGMITEEDSNFYKEFDKNMSDPNFKATDEQKARFKAIKKIRGDAKVVNFSAVYGVGARKMSLTTGWPISKCKKLLEAYWGLNKAVKMVANACITKTIGKQMWLFNPVSRFWYALRFEKDKFSTLNQGTGVYAFDTNIKHIRRRGVKICGQFHDEHVDPIKKGQEEQHKSLLEAAIADTNEELKLNVPLGISVAFGHSYADIH